MNTYTFPDTLRSARDYLSFIHTAVAELGGEADDTAFGRFFVPTVCGAVYVEHYVFGVDTTWLVGPIIYDDGTMLDEQYLLEHFDEAVRILESAQEVGYANAG